MVIELDQPLRRHIGPWRLAATNDGLLLHAEAEETRVQPRLRSNRTVRHRAAALLPAATPAAVLLVLFGRNDVTFLYVRSLAHLTHLEHLNNISMWWAERKCTIPLPIVIIVRHEVPFLITLSPNNFFSNYALQAIVAVAFVWVLVPVLLVQ